MVWIWKIELRIRIGALDDGEGGGAMPFSYVKEKFDFVDHEKLECKTTLLEGGGIGIKLESASSQIKFERKDDGGCVCQVVATYKLLPEVELRDESEAAKQSFVGIIKAAEAYLLANPDAYN
ncbi:pathogenesis-related protein 1-like protein [Carex littledalei]|uniref:Pathogenesis-related protein 1-like protein n=1 Tax=Carex littledalei TaxID=544730 RepID=A0A833QI35_9POAL|nr:pathogenesis-related protein 1-like protein [Carex littledalei]